MGIKESIKATEGGFPKVLRAIYNGHSTPKAISRNTRMPLVVVKGLISFGKGCNYITGVKVLRLTDEGTKRYKLQ